MQFFTWGINKRGIAKKRTALIQNHWDFIAKYDKSLIARGPVLDSKDLGIVRGSIHIVELPGFDEAKYFVNDEPFAKAGLFEKIILSRFKLELGRTQFDHVRKTDFPKFFLYCPAKKVPNNITENLANVYKEYCCKFDRYFLCRGSLLTDKGDWSGQIYLAEFRNSWDANSFLSEEPFNLHNNYEKTEVFRWTPGGPENLNTRGSLE